MQLKTSAFLMRQKVTLKAIIDALKNEFRFVSILGTDVFGTSYSVMTSGIHVRPSPATERGFVLRVMQDTGFSEYSFNVVDSDHVCRRMREIAGEDRARFLKTHPAVVYDRAPADESKTLVHIGEAEILPGEEDPEAILAELTDVHDRVKEKYAQVVQVMAAIEVTQVNKMFLSPNRDLYQSYAYANVTAMAAASDGQSVKTDYLTKSGTGGAEWLKGIEPMAEEAARRAEELLKSEKIDPGTYDIICTPDFTGLIAHEAFGHGAEMDMFVKQRAKGAEYFNKRIASDAVTMHDGAASCDEVASYAFDDEGNLACDTVIIDSGIFVQGMCDELSALLLDIKPTGNGRRDSWKRKAYTRMTNTFFAPGDNSLDEMIRGIDHGYILEGATSGMEDPKNWGIQCVATKGREIIDGRLTGRIVSPVYLTGYVPDLLASITASSPDLKLSGAGYCGKGWKEWVKVSTGGSHIKAKGILN